MLKQFNRFIILGLIVAVAVYVTITNSAPATIHLGGTSTITATAGVLYLAIFALGCLFTSLIALLWGVKAYFRERKLRNQVRTHCDFVETLVSGVGLMAIHEWGQAKDRWEDILASDPTNTLARIELSRCLEKLGDNSEALRVIDSARAQGAATIGILMRGYELNKTQGNLVGAKDNLVLLAQKHPSQHVLISLRELHLALRGYKEALQIQDKLESLGFRDSQEENPRAAIALRQINEELSETHRDQALGELIKRHSNYYPALLLSASRAVKRGDTTVAVENYIRAAKISKRNEDWKSAVSVWLNNEHVQPQQRFEGAIGVAKTACKSQSGLGRIEAELLLIEVLLAANHFHEVDSLIEKFSRLVAKTISTPLPEGIQERFLVCKGLYLVQTGKAPQSGPLWHELAHQKNIISCRSTYQIEDPSNGQKGSPSPLLSTP